MEDKIVKLTFGIHNHQPVGNFGWVFEESTEKSYLPFLHVLRDFPDIKTSIHTSGPLLEWIEANRPEYVEILGELVDRGQVEILGAGFYEPILTIIPEETALEQLDRMKQWAKSRLGADVRGIWLTERIWDPSLPVLLDKAGVEFTICDTTHFQWAGLNKDEIDGYFITEKMGHTVAVFPIDINLRYTIPFHDPEETIGILLNKAERDPGSIKTYADDGEKFGVWPGTYDLVFNRRWLARFFEQLQQHQDRIQTSHFSEILDSVEPKGKVMLPVASYLEMTQWALPAKAGAALSHLTHELQSQSNWERFEPFLRGGFWDNYLVKYPESNRIHKRMIRAADRIYNMSEGPLKEKAKEHLFKGQCNCAYWHGLFGGLYLGYLRDALTRNLIEAERIVDDEANSEPFVRIEQTDFDADGKPDIIMQSREYAVVISPALGGALSVVDLRQQGHAITNVMTRRPEAYHEEVRNLPNDGQDGGDVKSIHDIKRAKEPNLAQKLVYDPWDRLAFQEHFLPPTVSRERFMRVDDLPHNPFVTGRFTLEQTSVDDDRAVTVMSHKGVVGGAAVAMKKTVSIMKNEPVLRVDYELTADADVETRFAVENNLTLLAYDADDRLATIGDEKHKMTLAGEFEGIDHFTLFDGWQQFELSVTIDQTSTLWASPIQCVNQSESGYESTYQGTSFVFLCPVRLSAGKTAKVSVAWNLKNLK